MAVEVMKLNCGIDMPVIGLGTWLVCIQVIVYDEILAKLVYIYTYSGMASDGASRVETCVLS